MRIRVKSVGEVTKGDGKSKYFFFTMTYDKDGREEKRKVLSFNEEEYKAFKDAKDGDTFDFELKKDGEYWKWLNITPVAAGAANTGVKSFSNYDAVRQTSIVRQSSLAQAVAYHADGGNTVAEVIATAAEFEAWVNRVEEPAA